MSLQHAGAQPVEATRIPRDLVGCCLLLASNAGSFITGQAIYIEGGWLAGTPWDKTD
jgi:deoxycytidine triphosphate deaminase